MPPKVISGYVYALSDGTPNYYKLGKTKKPVPKRVAELQTGNKNKLRIVYSMRVDDMTRAEKSLHNIFSAQRREGEWFRLDRQSEELLAKIFKAAPTTDIDEARLLGFGLR